MSLICQIDDCAKLTRDRHDLCPMHYERVRRHGDPNTVVGSQPKERRCTVEGCDRKHHGRGYCNSHYRKLVRWWGDANDVNANAIGPPPSLPVQPLLDYIEAHGGLAECLDAAGYLGQQRDNVGQALDRAKRRQSRTIPVATADQLIIGIFGVHPFAVYGDAWWSTEEVLAA